MLFHPTRFLDLNTTLNRTIILNGCKLEALNRLLTRNVYNFRLISPFRESHVLQVVHGRRTTTPLRGKSDPTHFPRLIPGPTKNPLRSSKWRRRRARLPVGIAPA